MKIGHKVLDGEIMPREECLDRCERSDIFKFPKAPWRSSATDIAIASSEARSDIYVDLAAALTGQK